ncbi:hypothetical protein QFC20_006007 [Naganishia adeliensis]|uniref:Uncharacterized protein n=1 Tax=Naganishia adeliensis TaxID=92952 RepID=A0ACC2VIA6_9TREE|nr:hypothetical protein QFC20_006007 [Naganishia adeliensis]
MNLEVDLPDDRTSSAREVVLRYLKAMAETYSRNWVYDWSRTDWGNPFVKIQIQVMVDHELIRKRKLGAEELATDPGHWGIYDQRMIKGAKALSPSWILGPCGADVKTTWRSGILRIGNELVITHSHAGHAIEQKSKGYQSVELHGASGLPES